MLQVSNLTKEYSTPRGPLPVLVDVSFSLAPGDGAAIMGPSGAGKSSLLYILGALEPPTSGTVTLDGRNPFLLAPRELAAFRNTAVGFVFQDHCLLPQCTVLENVLIPTLVAPPAGLDTGHGADRATTQARDLIEQVGLSDRIERQVQGIVEQIHHDLEVVEPRALEVVEPSALEVVEPRASASGLCRGEAT